MSGAADLDDLAEQRLDGDLDDARWRELESAHGAALASALVRARALRGALAGLERPALPAAARAAIVAAAPPVAQAPLPAVAAPPLRFAWRRWAAPAALAAGLVVAVLALREDGRERHVDLAKRDAAATPPAAIAAPPAAGERSRLVEEDDADRVAMRGEATEKAARFAGADPGAVGGGGGAAPREAKTGGDGALAASDAGVRDGAEAGAGVAQGNRGADAVLGAPLALHGEVTGAPAADEPLPAKPGSHDKDIAPGALRGDDLAFAAPAGSGRPGAPADKGEAAPDPRRRAVTALPPAPSSPLPPSAPAAAGVAAAESEGAAPVDAAPAALAERRPKAAPPREAADAGAAADDAAIAELLDEARAFGAKPPGGAAAAPAPSPLGLELAWQPSADGRIGGAQPHRDAAAVEPQRKGGAAARTASIVLRNGTVGELALPPGALALVGLDGDGHEAWRATLKPGDELRIPGGETLTWEEPLTGRLSVPAAVVELRLQWGEHRSAPLPLAR